MQSASLISLPLLPLTRNAFAPFGDVIERNGAISFEINNGTTTRYHDLAQVQTLGESARPIVSIARCDQFHLPITVNMVERHPLGSQAFVPMDRQPYLVVVAPDNEGEPLAPLAFLATGDQGVNYHANIWHFTLVSFEGPADFLIVDRVGEGNNLEEYFYKNPYVIEKP